MKIFLAGTASHKDIILKNTPKFILESYMYIKPWQIELIPKLDDFILDSGAFTFLQSSKNGVNWDEYIERYADFIKQNNIQKYFELDIDGIVGYDKVKEYRKRLETLVGWQSIPVWHKNRTMNEYKRHCEEYPYVGIGGYVIKELRMKDFAAFPAMIRYAHQHDAKVHCLGFTAMMYLNKFHFDSTDSSTWINGARFGNCFIARQNILIQEHYANKRCHDVNGLAEHNLAQWIKFQKYAEENL